MLIHSILREPIRMFRDGVDGADGLQHAMGEMQVLFDGVRVLLCFSKATVFLFSDVDILVQS